MAAPGRRRDQGFTIVESLIALGLVFGVLVGLLATINTGVRGIVTGRQRSVAVSIANEVMETARSRSYADVGHDLDSDATLATDSAIRGTVPNLFYTGLGPGPDEPLVGSVVDAGTAAGTTSNPLFPFSPHRWTTVREATTYTTAVYVTRVVPTSGDPYRRLTVIVTWDRSQNAASAIPAEVRLSSYLFNAIQPPDPLFVGLAESPAPSRGSSCPTPAYGCPTPTGRSTPASSAGPRGSPAPPGLSPTCGRGRCQAAP
jgi:type II secretory pathway pseudopilin PulG